MTLRDLIDGLEDLAQEHGEDIDVRMAQQPRWAFEYSISEVAAVPARKGAAACVYLGEGSQLGYLPQVAAVALGWAEGRDTDAEEDEDECADCGRERASTKGREDCGDAFLCNACHTARLDHGRAHLTAEERGEASAPEAPAPHADAALCGVCGKPGDRRRSCQYCSARSWRTAEAEADPACPGCGCKAGDGRTPGCADPDGCGYWTAIRAAEPTMVAGGLYRIASVDHAGLNGRDHHPEDSDIGALVTAREMVEGGEAFEVWLCHTAEGRALELATYELAAPSVAERLAALRAACEAIEAEAEEGAEADAGFDAGEFSGPAWGRMIARQQEAAAARLGFASLAEAEDIARQAAAAQGGAR